MCKSMEKYEKVCWYGMYVKYIKAYQFFSSDEDTLGKQSHSPLAENLEF